MDIVNTVVTGYYPAGDVELGPYFKYLQLQPGGRKPIAFRLRTSNHWSKWVELEGYAAYGFTDGQIKFGLGGKTFLTKDPRLIVGLYYKKDMEQLGQSQNAFREDNFLGSFLRRNPNTKLTLVDEYQGYYEREWFTGFSNTVSVKHRNLFPRGSLVYVGFDDDQEPEIINSITTFEIALNTRFAYMEKYVSGEFTRVSLGTRYPILELHLGFGIKDVLTSDYEYQRIVFRVQQRIPLGPLGYFRYTATTGKIYGTLPYPLLLIHSGNETFYYDDLAFNTMNFFEFLSDRFVSVFLEHHLDGFLFNSVPLVPKTEMARGDQFQSRVRQLGPEATPGDGPVARSCTTLMAVPSRRSAVGVENIFKILRVDMVWRLTYLDHPSTIGTSVSSFTSTSDAASREHRQSVQDDAPWSTV